MPESITDFVMSQPLFDAHTHLLTMPDFARMPRCYAQLAGYAGADLITAAGPTPPGASALPPADNPGHKEAFFDLWRKSRNTGYCRATERACRDLLGVEFREENAEAVNEALAAYMADDPDEVYRVTIHDRANVARGIKDNICRPEDAADGLYPDFIRVNYRDDALLCIRSRTDVREREARWGRSVHGLDDLVDGLMQSISDCLATGKVTSFKIGVAYQRGLDFQNPTKHEAEAAFNRLMSFEQDTTIDAGGNVQMRLSSPELRPLQDYITHRYIRRATDEGLPIQVHTGYLAGNWRVLSNINPMQLAPVLLQYPRTRFDLFHAGWPYHDELGTIGKHFPNAWINLCWAWTMNPATMEYVLDAWLDGVPHNKIFAFGSDIGNPLLVYGYAVQAREGIARVLQRKIDRGDMDLALAQGVARAIMLDNGVEFHGLA